MASAYGDGLYGVGRYGLRYVEIDPATLALTGQTLDATVGVAADITAGELALTGQPAKALAADGDRTFAATVPTRTFDASE